MWTVFWTAASTDAEPRNHRPNVLVYCSQTMVARLTVSKIKAFPILLITGTPLSCVLDYNQLFKAKILKDEDRETQKLVSTEV